MSRDFELLQRLEREWGRPSIIPESKGQGASSIKNGILKIAEEREPAATRPNVHLKPFVRSELTKLVQCTFLSNPMTKVVMFTGIEAHEGAKWIAACTADILADTTAARVCLLDADLESPAIHRMYSVPNERGLVGALNGSCSISGATIRAGENLWVVPAGNQSGARSIVPLKFQEVVMDLMGQCDYLVISAPDCGKYAEVSAIGAASEGTVLVLDAATTRRVTAQQAKSALEMAKIRVLGSVLNNRSYPVPDLFYSRM
jgi:Mrp family chromosome partitioning ATPase